MPTRYIVHGTDRESKQVQKVIEAQTAAAAEQMAARLGVTVLGVEIESEFSGPPGHDAQRDVFEDARGTRRLGPETPLWSGTPSQWVNFWWFVSCVLVVTIPVAIWKFLDIRYSKYSLTTQRLRIERGVLTKVLDEVELYRIKDTQLHQTLLDRVLGIGTIEVLSSDETNPTLLLPKIPGAPAVREQLRQGVEKLRLARGVRELDLAMETPGPS